MRELMISLDQNIFNSASQVAQRMIEYEKNAELTILIPSANEARQQLGNKSVVAGSGGKNKIFQFFRVLSLASELLVERDIERVTVQDPFFTGFIGARLKKKNPHVTFEVQMHGDFYSSNYYRQSGLKNLFQYYLGKWFVLKKADTIRVVGERIKKSLLALGISPEKIVVRPVLSSQTLNRGERRDLHAAYPQFNKIFLCLGRLEPVKNIPWLLGVFKQVALKFPQAGLVIVGAGGQRAVITALIKKLRLEENVMLEPWTDDPQSYLKSADGVVFPSLSEGYGLVPMEAAQAGTPVVMTDVGVAHFELKASDKVRIVPVNDEQAFERELLSFLE